MWKLYEVFVQDTWNNNYWLGWFTDLDNCLEKVNSYIQNDKYKLHSGDLKEYPSTFNYCFDREIYDEDSDEVTYVRGFIHYFDNEEDYNTCKRIFVEEVE